MHPDVCELAEAIGQVHALLTVTQQTLLSMIATFDEAEGWADDGATSVVPWLVGMLGVSHRTAAEWVEVAGRLGELPAIQAAFGAGRLSWDQVRPLVRLATPETDAELAEAAAGWSAAQVARVARRARPVSDDEVADAHARRSLRWWWEDDRMLHLQGRLPDAEGAAVASALEMVANRAPVEEPWEARCADALVEVVASQGSGGRGEHPVVVVHTDAAVLAGEDGVGELESGPTVAAETVRRLACDGRLQVVADDGNGRTIGVGRATRAVPPWLRRVLEQRDRGCRFPGCERSTWTHAHHIRWWTGGGPTDANNLALVCHAHHRLIHEGGWTIEGDPDHDLRFVRPDGRVLTTGPPPIRPDLRDRFFPPAA